MHDVDVIVVGAGLATRCHPELGAILPRRPVTPYGASQGCAI